MKKIVLAVAAVAVLSACAKSPSSIAPVAVSSSEYSSLSCDILVNEMNRNSLELADAVSRQRSAQAADAVGVFLVLIPPSALMGDAEGDVALNKGEEIAMQREYDRRCRQIATGPLRPAS
ncbi:hypothetical protein [Pontivivens ytuae]|uniref:Lipoprotein n=1 Tax=Pontivivens ytuae TaxID=2789856 RepID=A0A7S9QC55_9RHOB|nr:hypothetical protein [Pontivivens ytuae]QPH53853.1 hypothetical protein I0K15_19090 [Pontivivens ytuae]